MLRGTDALARKSFAATLSPNERFILQLYYSDRLSAHQIESVLDIPANIVTAKIEELKDRMVCVRNASAAESR